jgi:hypothetical protein
VKRLTIALLLINTATVYANACHRDSDCPRGYACRLACWGDHCLKCVKEKIPPAPKCDEGEVVCRTNWGNLPYCAKNCRN